jgi:hypothetical protein
MTRRYSSKADMIAAFGGDEAKRRRGDEAKAIWTNLWYNDLCPRLEDRR